LAEQALAEKARAEQSLAAQSRTQGSARPVPISSPVPDLKPIPLPSRNQRSNLIASEAARQAARTPRPGFLTFLGVTNGALAAVAVGSALAALATRSTDMEWREQIEATGYLKLFWWGGLCLLTSLSCFWRGRLWWSALVLVYSYSLGELVYDFGFSLTGEVIEQFQSSDKIAGIVGIVIRLAICVYIHGKGVRAFHAVQSEAVRKIVVLNLLGFVLGYLATYFLTE
jgi:hypothetical protein